MSSCQVTSASPKTLIICLSVSIRLGIIQYLFSGSHFLPLIFLILSTFSFEYSNDTAISSLPIFFTSIPKQKSSFSSHYINHRSIRYNELDNIFNTSTFDSYYLPEVYIFLQYFLMGKVIEKHLNNV